MNPVNGGGAEHPPEAQRAFDHWLGLVRRRCWLRRLLEAVVIAAGLAVLATAAAIAYMSWTLFDGVAVDKARMLVYWTLPVLALLLILPRLLRVMSRTATARYVESRSQDLDALVISATEISERARTDGQSVGKGSLAASLLQRAAAVCAGTGVRTLESRRLRRSLTALAIILILAGAAAMWGPPAVRHGLALLIHPLSDPVADNPYRLAVEPGDLTLIEGEDQAITALSEGFRPDKVELLFRIPGGTSWSAMPMTASDGSARHHALLLNLQGPREYYVRSGAVESSRHRIDVVPRPRVSRIDLRYEYPARTGRAPELVEDGGAIRAVRGTRVEIRVLPDRPLAAGELVLDGKRRIALKAVAGELRADIELDQDGRYRIELPAGRAGMTSASPEHAIQVFEDGLPSVALAWPGRDTRVTRIEEIGISLQAEDDVAIRRLELVLNINGAEERVLSFDADPTSPAMLSGQHLLALEDLSLQPGDLISYYARVSDALDSPERVATSDLFFMDVRPFEQRFRRAQGGGGGGGGGQGQGNAELTAQQRSLVVALFKLERDRPLIEAQLLEQREGILKDAQARIRDRLDAIVRRLGTRGMVSENEAYSQVAEELPLASKAMVEVESRLAIGDLENALPNARQALLHLQRADAAFRDVQIAESRNDGAGGNSGSQAELANLFRLEMDKFRNQYEEMQRGQWNTPDHGLDQALNKLRELARRQQREVERTRMRGQRGRSDTTGRNSQQALAEEVEQLMRELERLTRQRNEAVAEQARRSLEQLRTAKREMEQAGRSGDAETGRQALERLRTVQRDLQRARPGGLANGVDKAVRRSRAAVAEQRDIMRQLNADLKEGEPERRRVGELVRRKRLLARELRDLDSEVEQLRRQAQSGRSPAVEDLDAAGRTLREQMLEQRMLESASALRSDPQAHAAAGETDLGRDLESVQRKLAQAGRILQQDEGPDRLAALERLRALVRGLKADQQRLAEAAKRGGASGAEKGAQAAGGKQPSQSRGADGASAQSGSGGSTGPYAGYDRGYSIDPSTIRQQVGARMRDISSLHGDFDAIGDLADDVQAVLAALNESRVDGAGGIDLETLRMRQAELLARLQNLELALRESPETKPDSLIARHSAELAPRYQSLVEQYYRRLSEEAVSR